MHFASETTAVTLACKLMSKFDFQAKRRQTDDDVLITYGIHRNF